MVEEKKEWKKKIWVDESEDGRRKVGRKQGSIDGWNERQMER